jgi:hypothetical protein
VTPVIRIDDEVMAKLKERAIAFNLVFEPPNSTLRIILGLDLQAGFHPEAVIPLVQAKPQKSDKGREYVVEGTGGSNMRGYVRTAKERYANKQTDKDGFVTEVWNGIKDSAESSGKGQHIVERATEAFMTLCEENGRSPVSHRAILEKAGLQPNQTSSLLWPWLDRNAGVIRKEKDDGGKRRYSVPDDDFYAALRKVVLRLTGSQEAKE